MKLVKYLFLISVFLLHNGILSAQLSEDEIITIDGNEFIQHRVKSGETIFSLCSQYEVENKKLIQYNPALVQGLKAGDYIRIPYKKGITLNNNVDQEQQKPSEFIIHKIQRRETPYFVAKKYGIQIEDIYKYNPDLKKFKNGWR